MTRKLVVTVGVVPAGLDLDGYVDVCEAAGSVRAIVWVRLGDGDDPAVIAGMLPSAVHGWVVEERPQWDGATAGAGRPVPGIKQVTFLRRAPGIDRASFAAHWTDVHAPLARRHHPALWRYQQNVVLDTVLPGTPDFDGIAELGMRLRQDFRDRMYDSDEGRRIVGEDVRMFIDLRNSTRYVVREHPVYIASRID